MANMPHTKAAKPWAKRCGQGLTPLLGSSPFRRMPPPIVVRWPCRSAANAPHIVSTKPKCCTKTEAFSMPRPIQGRMAISMTGISTISASAADDSHSSIAQALGRGVSGWVSAGVTVWVWISEVGLTWLGLHERFSGGPSHRQKFRWAPWCRECVGTACQPNRSTLSFALDWVC